MGPHRAPQQGKTGNADGDVEADDPVGRTDFMNGLCGADHVAFDGFALPRAPFADAGLRGDVTFSVRPQSIAPHRGPPATARAGLLVAGRLLERAFLGETWDYVVAPDGGALRLKVAALPFQVFEVGEAVWLAFDPGQMAPIAA